MCNESKLFDTTCPCCNTRLHGSLGSQDEMCTLQQHMHLLSCNINKALDTSQVRFDTATYEVRSVLLQKHNALIIENRQYFCTVIPLHVSIKLAYIWIALWYNV